MPKEMKKGKEKKNENFAERKRFHKWLNLLGPRG